MVMATPLPMRAGKLEEEAATVCPPSPVVTPEGGLRKSKVYYRELRYQQMGFLESK